MKNQITKLLVMILCIMSTNIQASTLNPDTIIGTWLGKMKVSDALELSVGFDINQLENQQLGATMHIVEQRAFDIPMDKISFENDSLHIEFVAAGISYSGRFDSNTITINGHYIQGDTKIELVLHHVDQIPREIVRPQTPMAPFPYKTEEILFTNRDANITLAGTLTMPVDGSSFPAIILAHGSGHTDRNETAMGHFTLLADYFTRQGFAVLRYDKRGVKESGGNYDEATTIDFAKDLKSGIEYLKNRSDINASEIGIIGHSEGTLIAPMVASEVKDLAFIILMGAMGVNGGEIRIQQTEKIMQLNGTQDSLIKIEIDQIRSYHSIILSKNDSITKSQMISAKHSNLSEGLINYLMKPWYKCFIEEEPTEYLRKVTCPVLALSGEKDVQCPADGNLPQIEAALRDGGNSNFTVKTIPSVNHLFQTAKSGLPVEYENIAEIIAPSVLDLMNNWILNR